jgi:hypothetical protein
LGLPLQHGLCADAFLNSRITVEHCRVDVSLVQQTIKKKPFSRRP